MIEVREGREDLPIHLVELRVDVFDGVVQSRDNDMLNGIDTSVGSTNDFVKDCESSLHVSFGSVFQSPTAIPLNNANSPATKRARRAFRPL